jgi:endonuclease YncB( thermonuclease family)
MRGAVPAISAVAFVLIGFGMFVAGRQAAPEAPAPVEAGLPDADAADATMLEAPAFPPPAASRLIAPKVVAPPELDPDDLQRAAPRAPLSELSKPLPPRKEETGGMLFRPLALESAVVEAMGRKVAIAGTESLPADETCDFEGERWPCGMRARTAFRMWLRGRALDCDLPPDAGDEVTASCSLGRQDAGAWLVANGWARASPGSRYAEAEAAARAAGKGIFGPPPDLSDLPPVDGATASTAASPPTPPAGPTMQAQ